MKKKFLCEIKIVYVFHKFKMCVGKDVRYDMIVHSKKIIISENSLIFKILVFLF